MGKVLEILNGKDSCQELVSLHDEIELYTKSILEDYLEKTRQYCKQHSLSPNNTKNFYDAVWGTIEINEGERFILNSPILQRLRRIKQLGLADLLYSSANHSRLSHTLGVLQTASSMWTQIEKELSKNRVTFDCDIEQIVRLAAIFHDCGHMFCSHASERFFQSDTSCKKHNEVEKVRNHFKKKLQIKPSLSEILSILIVNSSSVRELLSLLDDGLKELEFNNRKQDKIVEKICCLIIGLPYSTKTIPYSQIICGQIDSDKLDYLRRDSHMTGVPVAVDMSRVFQKLRMVPTSQHYTMLSDASETASSVYKLGIAPAAINTVDQLIISRYMMFENIYFHQKVLTAEEMLRYALRMIDESTSGLLDNFSVIMRFDDSIIVNGNFRKSVDEIAYNKFVINNEQLFSEACALLQELSLRNLFKRCISFTSENLTDIGFLETEFYSKAFVQRDLKLQKGFLDAVKAEVKIIKDLLKDKYQCSTKTDILLIVTPEISSAALNSNIAIADKINKDRNMVFEADNWLKSRSTRKPQNYLVSYEEDRYIVFIAAEKILFRQHGLLINDTIIFDENDETEILQIKKDLDSNGYYNDTVALIPDDDLKRYAGRIDDLVNKWKTYERFDPLRGDRKGIDAVSLSAFIKQFIRFRGVLQDYDIFVRGCLDLLDHVLMISHGDILKALKDNLIRIRKEFKCASDQIQICCLGTVQDSGSQISYQMNDVNNTLEMCSQGNIFTVGRLEDLRTDELKPVVVFIEDAFCSGKQILSMFETYMGVPSEQRQTDEVHVKELSDEMKEQLKSTELVFSFIFYNETNEEEFRNKLKELGLTKVHLYSHRPFPQKYFSDMTVEDKDGQEMARKYFLEAGKMLIKEKAYENGKLKSNWSQERADNSVLGFNDDQQLIVFPWNTPTYTMTALWLGSKSEQWYPLFSRINKAQKSSYEAKEKNK